MYKKKSLGQHFLVDLDVIKQIINSVPKLEHFNLVEIGPGSGALTNDLYLLNYQKFVLIEKDFRLSEDLKIKYSRSNHICADAVSVNYNDFLNNEDINILVSNLPYYASSKILVNAIKYFPCFKYMILMFQKELADRITAKHDTNDYSRISVTAQECFEISKLFDVKARSFSPPPKVDSTVLFFKSRERSLINPDNRDLYNKFIDKAFMHRRKKLKYALNFFDRDLNSLEGIDINKRVGEFTIFDFEKISNYLNKKVLSI